MFNKTLQYKGIEIGSKSKKHPDQELQEIWDQRVLDTKEWGYQDFQDFKSGYEQARIKNQYA